MAEKLTKAQMRCLAEIADRLPGTRPITGPDKIVYRALEKRGLIQRVRMGGGMTPVFWYARTDEGRATLSEDTTHAQD